MGHKMIIQYTYIQMSNAQIRVKRISHILRHSSFCVLGDFTFCVSMYTSVNWVWWGCQGLDMTYICSPACSLSHHRPSARAITMGLLLSADLPCIPEALLLGQPPPPLGLVLLSRLVIHLSSLLFYELMETGWFNAVSLGYFHIFPITLLAIEWAFRKCSSLEQRSKSYSQHLGGGVGRLECFLHV